MIIVSACLAGVKCRYDGKANTSDRVRKLFEDGEALPLCPEVLGGMTIPRVPAEICDSRVVNRDGEDVTDYFKTGAEKALAVAVAAGCKKAILKGKSPSCGRGEIYDGTFSKKLIDGNGITAELFIRNGIEVYTEDEI